MRELTPRERPRCTEVFRKVGSLLDFGDDAGVDMLLVLGLRFGEGLLGLGLATLKELLFGGGAFVRL